MRRLIEFFFAFPEQLDRWLRRRDFRRHRIEHTWLHRHGLVIDHSPLAFWLVLPILGLVLWGLPRWRGWWLPVVLIAAVAVLIAFCAWARRHVLAFGVWAVIASCAAAAWWLAGGGSRAADPAPYRHLLQLLVPSMAVLAMIGNRWWAARCFRPLREDGREVFARHLHRAQLFDRSTPTEHDRALVLRAFALVPIASPVLLALLVAATVLAVPRTWVWPAFLIGIVVWMGVLGAAHYHRRLTTFRTLIEQALLIGGPLAMSAGVILFGAVRLAGVDYVTTVLDHWHTRVIVGVFFLAGYLTFWLYSYWTQRAVAEVLLGMLDSRDAPKSRPVRVPYRRGLLQLHGAGRFLALDPNPDDVDRPRKFHAHRPLDVFRRVADRLLAEARVKPRDDQADERWARAHRADQLYVDFGQRKRIYHSVPAVVVGALVIGTILLHSWPVQDPAVLARAEDPATAPFDLIAAWRRSGDGGPALMLAASGGGTRAALYAYGMLRGIEAEGALERVVAASGVSGGSLGVAYFGAHRDALCAGDGDAWRAYRDAVSAPHFRSVLAGVGEVRLIAGTRLGQLLAESIGRYLTPRADATFAAAAGSICGRRAGGLGVILNASLAGDGAIGAAGPPPVRDGSSQAAGGRLALSNIRGFAGSTAATAIAGWGHDLPVVVLADPAVALARAAAVSANFPPVFPNAAVDDVGGGRRYWVTDGGAMDNRGLVALLLAMRAALAPLAVAERATLPPARILVAEASAFSTGYRDDRGTGAPLAARAQLANKLIGELLREVRALAPGVELVDLPMPDALRISGSFGTHWMMPVSILVRPPACAADAHDADASVRLSGAQLLAVVDRIFARDRSPVPDLDAEANARLWRWLTCPKDPAQALANGIR